MIDQNKNYECARRIEFTLGKLLQNLVEQRALFKNLLKIDTIEVGLLKKKSSETFLNNFSVQYCLHSVHKE